MYKSKYKAKKTVVDGITFDSKKEATRYLQLKDMQDKGIISNLERQIEYELIPRQVDDKGKFLMHPIKYICDFRYIQDGNEVVEDSKGMKTPEYRMKKKMMYYFHKILLKET